MDPKLGTADIVPPIMSGDGVMQAPANSDKSYKVKQPHYRPEQAQRVP